MKGAQCLVNSLVFLGRAFVSKNEVLQARCFISAHKIIAFRKEEMQEGRQKLQVALACKKAKNEKLKSAFEVLVQN